MSEAPGPRIDRPIPEISQIAFVVEDLEASMRRFSRLLGIEPWLLYRYEPPRLSETTFRGESGEYSMRVAITDVEGPVDVTTDFLPVRAVQRVLGWAGSILDRLGVGTPPDQSKNYAPASFPRNPGLPGVNVELIEPLDGPSTYTEFLDRNGTGIHHVGCFAYDDPYGVVEKYRDADIPIIQSGRFEGIEFWYLDMRDELDGLLFEIAANLWALPAPDAVFPE